MHLSAKFEIGPAPLSRRRFHRILPPVPRQFLTQVASGVIVANEAIDVFAESETPSLPQPASPKSAWLSKEVGDSNCSQAPNGKEAFAARDDCRAVRRDPRAA
jgi:hypothetical protein